MVVWRGWTTQLSSCSICTDIQVVKLCVGRLGTRLGRWAAGAPRMCCFSPYNAYIQYVVHTICAYVSPVAKHYEYNGSTQYLQWSSCSADMACWSGHVLTWHAGVAMC